ncbi:MAG TPA: F0F1 ATP synthase subunit epsilon [Candidatus Acidoferrum sp.]|jgi:F-type H+-transporting ATPase subunit epsilon|nr:F0F1 ATP synthase subunit epsilon [Candidatus Acidoferrum sp.]
MLPESIQLIVVTPERQLLRESVVEVTVPGLDGQLGILPGHAPLMTELGIGELSYRMSTSGQPVVLAVISGFAEVLPDRVTVLAETAERAEEIDLARAEQARARAEKRLSAGDTNLDWDRANIALQRSLIRIQVARKRHSVLVEPR